MRRLLTAQILVIITMALTVIVVADLLGPPMFRTHLHMADPQPGALQEHAQAAFVSAGLSAVLVGLAVACLGALMITVVVAKRLGRALTALTHAAQRVAAGDYSTPVQVSSTAREFDAVAGSFNAMAARLDRTETIRRRLLTDLSHELRTPIAAIAAVAEGLEDEVIEADQATVAMLRLQTQRLARLATDLKDISAAEEGQLGLQLQAQPLLPLVQAAVDTAQPSADKAGVRLRLETVCGREAQVCGEVDATRIGQVMDNLLRNAVHHTPPGGHVLVRLHCEDDHAVITVSDDGHGIDAADLPHVFQRFYRAQTRRHDQGEGTGLGLSISAAIATAHRGALTADSQGLGQGASFHLRLPVTL